MADSLTGLSTNSYSTDEILLPGHPGNASFRTATAEEVFGPASTVSMVCEPPSFADPDASFTSTPVWAGAVVACFIGYCLIIYYFRGLLAQLFQIFRGQAFTEKALGEQSRLYNTFLNWTVALGTLVLGLGVLKFAAIFMTENLTAIPRPLIMASPLIAWAAAGVLCCFRFLLLKSAGGLVMQGAFVQQLLYLRKILAALTTFLITPPMLLLALSDGEAANVLAWIVGAMMGIFVILLISRTFMLFIRQSFSISLWFLYLCAVEILPVSLIWIAAVKTIG